MHCSSGSLRAAAQPPVLAAIAVVVLCSSVVSAQPTLTASQNTVAPGATVNVTVTGTAGDAFAVVGSTVDSGLSYAGTDYALGADFVVLTTGALDGSGQATVPILPPFRGTVLDRYYLQGVTSPTAGFSTLVPTNGLVLRNADLVAGLAPAITLPSGESNFAAPPALVHAVLAACQSIPVSVTITAPTGGNVAVSAVFSVSTNQSSFGEFHLSDAPDTCNAPAGSVAVADAPFGAQSVPYSTQRLFAVTAGPHTFYLNAVNLSSLIPQRTLTVLRANLRAIFLP